MFDLTDQQKEKKNLKIKLKHTKNRVLRLEQELQENKVLMESIESELLEKESTQ